MFHVLVDNVKHHNDQVETSHFHGGPRKHKKIGMNIDEIFRSNLKKLRTEAGMDAKALSLKAKLGERAVKDIEEGRSQSPKLSTAFKLAKALEVDVAVILGISNVAKIRSELVDFLAQYDEDGQAQLLAALSAIPRQPS